MEGYARLCVNACVGNARYSAFEVVWGPVSAEPTRLFPRLRSAATGRAANPQCHLVQDGSQVPVGEVVIVVVRLVLHGE